MTTYSKETALFKESAIKNGLADAANRAELYLAEINDKVGVFVHPSGTPKDPTDSNARGVQITEDVDIIRNGESAAEFGESARIGKESDNNGRVYANERGIMLRSPTVINVYSVAYMTSDGLDISQYRDSKTITGQHISGHGFNNVLYSRKPVGTGETVRYFVSEVLDNEGFKIVHDKGEKPISSSSRYHENVKITDDHFRMEGDRLSDFDEYAPYVDFGINEGDDFRLGLYDIENDQENDYFSVDQEGNINAEGKITANAITQNLFVVESHNVSLAAGTSGNNVTDTQVVNKPGYYPLGIVGYGTGRSAAVPARMLLSEKNNGSATISYSIRAIANFNAATMTVDILWLKTSI